MHRATLVERSKRVLPTGEIVERVIWFLPSPVPPSGYDFKYRLVLIRDGLRVVGYDNERGEGDHRHHHGAETRYHFVSIDGLIADFEADVTRET
jgi:hypothetical protein